MHRAFAENQNLSQSSISISDKNEIHHIRDVLRLKVGETIVVFNGRGLEATAKIDRITKKEIQLEILKVHPPLSQNDPPYIILACAIPKRDKFEWIIEKACELGVMEIFPVKTARTEFTLNKSRLEKKQERYKAVAVNAAKQCQRLTVPKIHPITAFHDLWDQLTPETELLIPALIEDRKTIKEACASLRAKRFAIMIGPEGDFTPQEVEEAVRHGATPVSLGNTVLKVETAAISSIAFTKLFFKTAQRS